jgi:hypothetical protein
MTNLPMIPQAGSAIALTDLVKMEERVAQQVSAIDDVDTLLEWKAQAAALEQYLRGKELNGPMLGAQRRVEARIGQLLGVAQIGNPHGKLISHAREITPTDRQRFRILARGLERGLPDEEWRAGREKLIKVIQQRFPMPKHVPTVVTESGQVRKSRADRVKEITSRAQQGMNAAQIAADIGIGEQNIRQIANEEGIQLPDFTIGKVRRLDAKRILTETISGVDAYMSSLSMLDDVDLPRLSAAEISDLTQALSRSINGLRKLRTRMEKAYAGHDATAA